MIRSYLLVLFVIVSFYGYSQTLYAPGGTVGLASGANVGVGTSSPQYKLDVVGDIQTSGTLRLQNSYMPVGLNMDLGSSQTPLLNFGANFPLSTLNSNLPGGAFRVDTRDSQSFPMFQWISRAANSTVYNVMMALSSGGNLAIGRDQASPNYRLDVNGNVNTSGEFANFQKTGSQAGIRVNTSSANTGIQFLKYGVKHAGMIYDGSKIVFKGLSSGNDFNPDLALPAATNAAESAAEHVNVAILGNMSVNTIKSDAALTVNGTVHSKEVLVDINGVFAVPDYVFESDYKLLPLRELEQYLKANKHLPEVLSAEQMEADGMNLKEMNLILLKKVEELTLYVIQQQKAIEALQKTK